MDDIALNVKLLIVPAKIEKQQCNGIHIDIPLRRSVFTDPKQHPCKTLASFTNDSFVGKHHLRHPIVRIFPSRERHSDIIITGYAGGIFNVRC